MLRWARERARLEPGELAKKLNVTESRILDWENNQRRPTFKQAKTFAKATYVPFAFLFLKEPPEPHVPIPDFRRLPAGQQLELSPNFYDLLQDVMWKHDWYKAFLTESGTPPRNFVASYPSSSDPIAIATAIDERIAIDAIRRRVTSWSEFFRSLVSAFEDIGVLVLRNGMVGNNPHRTLDFREFRGFAIADPVAPLVFINTRDAVTAKIFTLIHEAAHLWVGESGISNPDPERSTDEAAVIERLCNQTAAEVLFPQSIARTISLDRSDPHRTLSYYAQRYRVSTFMVLVQLRKTGHIEEDQYRTILSGERSRWQEPEEQKSRGGGSPYRNYRARFGRNLVQAVAYSVKSGRTLYRDGAQLLGVKPRTLDEIAQFEGISKGRE